MNATVEALCTNLEIEEEAVTQYLTEEYANSRYSAFRREERSLRPSKKIGEGDQRWQGNRLLV
ncbi:MAG: hypothetical protein ACLTXL_01585 [Clostridia bacterium]